MAHSSQSNFEKERFPGEQSILDFTGGYGFRQDIHNGKCHTRITETDISDCSQQNISGSVIWGIQGDVPR